MSAAQVTPDDAKLPAFLPSHRSLSNPESAHPSPLSLALMPTSRGHDGVVDADEKRVAPRGAFSQRFVARVARHGRVRIDGEVFFIPRETIFDDEIIASFDRAIVTYGHGRKRIIGTALFPRVEAERFVTCDIFITNAHAAHAIALGVRQISVGYEFDVIDRVVRGEPLRFVTRYRLTHLALVRSGAHGDTHIIDPNEEQLPKEIVE